MLAEASLTAGHRLRMDVEDFLYAEADLLQERRLEEWLTLFEEDGCYHILPIGIEDMDIATASYILADDMACLRARVKQLRTDRVVAEVPPSKVCRLITNVRVKAGATGVEARANFFVQRTRHAQPATFVGEYRYTLTGLDGDFRIRRREVRLSQDSIHQGNISFIL